MSIDLHSLGWQVALFVNLTNRSERFDEINAIADQCKAQGALLYLHDDFLASLDAKEYEGQRPAL